MSIDISVTNDWFYIMEKCFQLYISVKRVFALDAASKLHARKALLQPICRGICWRGNPFRLDLAGCI